MPRADKITATRFLAAFAIACALLAMLRVVWSHDILSVTTDEPPHVVTGLEWLQEGRYTYEPQHPPIARVAAAIGPYAAGARVPTAHGKLYPDGDAILGDPAEGQRYAVLARRGILPFLAVAFIAVWLWGRRTAEPSTAWLAVLLFGLTPPILAHAGLATTDLPLSAMVAMASFLFARWLDSPGSASRALAFAVVAALSFCTKFSAIPYLLVIGVGWSAARFVGRNWPEGVATAPFWRRFAFHVAPLAIASGALVISAVYRFSVGDVRGLRVLAPEFFHGIGDVARHNAEGHVGYLLGHVSLTGSPLFFPVALLVKTPIPLLLTATIGGAVVCRRWWRTRRVIHAEPLLAIAAILGVSMSARINMMGIRHVLPVYVWLAVLGAIGLAALWRAWDGHTVPRFVSLALMGWLWIDVARIQPDHIAYFNEFVRRDPGRVLIGSDLDWGQDVLRLQAWARERGVQSFHGQLFGYGEPRRLDLPIMRKVIPLRPYDHVHGWVAISESMYRLGAYRWDSIPRPRHSRILEGPMYTLLLQQDAYHWLDAYTPVAHIGRSIRIYNVP